ncbi:MAG TPA: hypothetical protein ENL05_00990 [Candidatus Moranbacteria bacterium]|nr:hypothetical protein [Candidatus Moranbacteria bacterium]
MKKYKIGFCKKVQGVFSENTIKEIEKKLALIDNVELFTNLDFRKAFILNGNVYIGDFNLNSLDIYFWHDTVKPNDWKGDNFYLHVLAVLEKDCLVINTSQSTKITNDKFLAHTILRKNNLPVADFALIEANNKEGLKEAFKQLGESILIKPRFGGWGIGIVKVDKLEDLFSSVELLLSFLPNKNQSILLEKYYENDPTRWISVVVMGNKVLFGYQKTLSKNSSWKIYDPDKKDGRGENSQYINPPQKLKDLALKAKQIIGKDIIGFDFIYTKEGYKIIDENGRPGLYQQCWQKANLKVVTEITKLILGKLKDISKD